MPGILVILVTLIGAYVTALNLVREKEIGTIEQINAQACNLILNPVCGDDWVTYDNECLACASNEIDWYVLWPCNPSCDDEGELCSINLTENENNLNPEGLIENTSPTQEVWLELIVVNPEE